MKYSIKYDTKYSRDDVYESLCVYLMLNGHIHTPFSYQGGYERYINDLKNIRRILFDKYFNYIYKYIPGDAKIIVELSGGDLDIDYLVSSYKKRQYPLFNLGSNVNISFLHERWNIRERYGSWKVSFLILTSRALFERLFRKYWFPLGPEYDMTIMILNDLTGLYDLPQIISQLEGDERLYAMANKSLVVFNNFQFGFNFKVISDKKAELMKCGIKWPLKFR